MDRIMIETDSPYLSPVPFRGKRNDSTRVHLVAETIAQIKGMDPEEVARINSGERPTLFPHLTTPARPAPGGVFAGQGLIFGAASGILRPAGRAALVLK